VIVVDAHSMGNDDWVLAIDDRSAGRMYKFRLRKQLLYYCVFALVSYSLTRARSP
jgi:hypothetical protein